MYLAAVDGKNVLDKAEIIGDEVLAGLVVQMEQGFEATNIEWAEGMFNALERILLVATPQARRDALERMRELCVNGH